MAFRPASRGSFRGASASPVSPDLKDSCKLLTRWVRVRLLSLAFLRFWVLAVVSPANPLI